MVTMRGALLLALLSLVRGGPTGAGPVSPPRAYRVLFVGNYLTYTNDLPAMVAAIAAAEGDTFFVSSQAYPDWGLQDHWERGRAPAMLMTGTWDVVVMQQGP